MEIITKNEEYVWKNVNKEINERKGNKANLI